MQEKPKKKSRKTDGPIFIESDELTTDLPAFYHSAESSECIRETVKNVRDRITKKEAE